MMRPGWKETTKAWIKIAGIVLFITVLSLLAIPYIQKLQDPVVQEKVQEWVQKMGVYGWLILLAVMFLQVVIAFIPGGPVELLAGVLYGGLGGLAVCMVGAALASALIFSISKKYGTPLVKKLFPGSHFEKFSFLRDSKKLDMTVFLLFLIPGMPKDMLTYIVGTSSMTLSRFLLLSLLARTPSVITSTYIGASVRKGNWKETVLIFIITAAMGITGILVKDKVLRFSRKISPHIHIEHAVPADAEEIQRIMNRVSDSMQDPDHFVADDLSFIKRHIQDSGWILKAESGGEMAGYMIIRIPGLEEDNLGYDLGFDKEELKSVAHMESIAVLPGHRGKRIQKHLLHEAEKECLEQGYTILAATVDPDNQYSLANFTDCGYQAKIQVLKYGNKKRMIMLKRTQSQTN